MPHEVREIFFSDAELHQGVDRYRQDNPGRFPKGKLTACQRSADGIKAFFRSSGAARISSCHVIPRSEAIRILIHLCMDQNIPLPRTGSKTLGPDGDMVCLRVELTTGMLQKNAQAAKFA